MRRRAAWLARGQASDKEMSDEDDDPKVPVELQEQLRAITMFQHTLLFSEGAATALYDDQVVQSLDTLCEINDDMTKEMCRVIRKPGDDGYGISPSSL